MKIPQVGDIWLHECIEFPHGAPVWVMREVLILEISKTRSYQERVEMLVLTTGKRIDCFLQYFGHSNGKAEFVA